MPQAGTPLDSVARSSETFIRNAVLWDRMNEDRDQMISQLRVANCESQFATLNNSESDEPSRSARET
jgi:hypothetical protein